MLKCVYDAISERREAFLSLIRGLSTPHSKASFQVSEAFLYLYTRLSFRVILGLANCFSWNLTVLHLQLANVENLLLKREK